MNRRDYMDRKVTHSEYYGALADAIGREAIARMVLPLIDGLTAEHLTIDPHLNRIPLRRWDMLHGSISAMVARDAARIMAISWDGAPLASPRHYVWSLADSGCVAKEVARAILQARPEVQR